jgi:Leucine-rich repeat (LRR) protein
VLSLKGNELKTVPGALASLPHLRRLLLVDNLFEEVPLPLLLSKSLCELDLSLNRITR